MLKRLNDIFDVCVCWEFALPLSLSLSSLLYPLLSQHAFSLRQTPDHGIHPPRQPAVDDTLIGGGAIIIISSSYSRP
jgi:hypothetical protein